VTAASVVPEHANLPSIDAFVARLGTGSAAGTCSAARGSAGAVAALAAALAVDLAAQVALDSPEWGERGGALAQAAVIRDRSIRLARPGGAALRRGTRRHAPRPGRTGHRSRIRGGGPGDGPRRGGAAPAGRH
jgi:hypothetical protein